MLGDHTIYTEILMPVIIFYMYKAATVIPEPMDDEASATPA
jgi:hypothetical protein